MMEKIGRFLERQTAKLAIVNQYSIKRSINFSVDGNIANTGERNFALFAHWDPHGLIDNYVIHHLKFLCEIGVAPILISTSDKLSPYEIDRAKKYTHKIISRKNTGLDFASWKQALISCPEALERNHLFFLNDSVYGPFRDISNTYNFLLKQTSGLWGMNDSFEKNCRHIQSFFLCFTPQIVMHPYFRKFIDQIGILDDKEEIIVRYEVGLSGRTARHSISLNPLFPFIHIAEHCKMMGDKFQYQDWVQRGPFNSTIFAWDLLLKDFDYPFLKTEVLKKNRFNSQSVKYWRDFIPNEGKSLIPIIENHISRVTTS
ncbi:rhamnan synthesis F family protein [Pseudobacteriovorax antillogorgiicola]|uniref:Rhamnan synthesis protein F n=1 Tax=Pseudobacteriovorax antillogorgiicola TaxID=1513793 RepID=A0A1Y6CU66_9BACT|nr:rhamnan synthesis F family protein [Pseudobacteriovorax antillogorgiicola]TCS45241.1 rhamnan synthesis protein F [Pseudobacteriovorax antillogorgiicola]SMF75255.1 Rhamnan synthesis protein F [Pseudobacteriovorax antillogorgiicola]